MSPKQLRLAFGDRVRTCRREKTLTQAQLAAAIGKNVNTISNIERGLASTRLDTALSISKALNVELSYLFEFLGMSSAKREKKESLVNLVTLVSPHHPATIGAIAAQAKILIHLISNPVAAGRHKN